MRRSARSTRSASSASSAIGMALVASIVAGAGQPVLADWRADHKVLRVGFLATSGAAYDRRRLEPFRAYLQSRLSLPIELVPATTYSALIDGQASDRVQYVIHSALSYATTALNCRCVEPLAIPTAFDGARGFYAILLARAGSGIDPVTDARGARLAVSRDDSIAGRVVPVRFLAHEGIEAAGFFSQIIETAGPEAAITALLTGKADVAVGWSSLTGDAAFGYDFGVLTRMAGDGRLSMDDIRVIWQSPLVPFGPHAVRRDLPDDIKSRLAAALMAMAVEAPETLDAVDRSSIGGGGFVPVDAGDYVVIEEVLATPVSDGGR